MAYQIFLISNSLILTEIMYKIFLLVPITKLEGQGLNSSTLLVQEYLEKLLVELVWIMPK